MNLFISDNKSQEEDRTGNEDSGSEPKKVREDFLVSVIFE